MATPTPTKDLSENICSRITQFILENKLSNDNLVQIIEHTGSYLNLCTRSAYAKQCGVSYNGAKKFRRNIRLFGVNFIIDND